MRVPSDFHSAAWNARLIDKIHNDTVERLRSLERGKSSSWNGGADASKGEHTQAEARKELL